MLVRYPGHLHAWEKTEDPEVKMETPFMRAFIQKFIHPLTKKTFDFSQADVGNCLAVVPLTWDKNVILTNQWKQAVAMLCPQFPGGRVTPGKAPEEIARELLLRETGYTAQTIRILPTTFHFYDTILANHYVIAIATGCRFDERPADPSAELLQVMELSMPELLDMMRQGKIFEPATYVGVLSAMLHGHLPPISRL